MNCFKNDQPGLKTLKLSTDGPIVLSFFIRNQDYITYQDACEINEAYLKNFFYGTLPPNMNYNQKYILGVFEQSNLITVIDLLEDFPEKNHWALGFFMVDHSKRRCGIGTNVMQTIEELLIKKGALSIRLGVLIDNYFGIQFWESLGFVALKIQKRHKDGRIIQVYRKQLQ